MLRLLDNFSRGCLPVAALVLVQLVRNNGVGVTSSLKLPQLPLTSDYCKASLCSVYNGSHIIQLTNTACGNNNSFWETCGPRPKIILMNKQRRQLLLDMHNLVRATVAEGLVLGYEAASNMPVIKWDTELEHMATLHVKRCKFAHDECRNTPRFPISGQNIGYFWIGRDFKSYSRRLKFFVINWFREYKDANQSFIDSFHPHPQGKKVGHFTLLVADQVRRMGCAGVRFLDPSVNISQFLLTCNYDYNNVFNEPIYQKGASASQCDYRVSEKYPFLCDWQDNSTAAEVDRSNYLG